jgi:AraC-like DNA-binding protein
MKPTDASPISVEDITLAENIRKFLTENLNTNFTKQHLINHFHTTDYFLSEKFEKITGYTPKQLVIELRMKKAIEFLKSDNPDIANAKYIADAIGYKSVESFLKAFKKKFGYYPRTVQANN